MAPTADVRTAIAAFLKAEVEGAEGRVYRPELPESARPNMPQACIVVYAGGGGQMFGRDRLPVFDDMIDLACYGSTRLEAETIGDEALYALRELGHKTYAGMLLHWARIAGSVKSAIDPETTWPIAVITTQVMHSFP